MYLRIIMFISFLAPIMVMPRDIVVGAKSPYKIVLHASLFASAGALLVFMFASTSDMSIYEQVMKISEAAVDTLVKDPKALEFLGMTDMSLEEQKDMLVKLYASYFDGLPVAIMSFNAVVAYFEYMIMSRLIKRNLNHVKTLPPLREFNLPPGAVWGVMAMYLIAYIMTSTEIMPNDLLYLNMNGVFDFVFTVQGISVVLMLFHMKKLPKPLAYVVTILVWGTAIGRWLLVFTGMFDVILGLKFRMQNSKPRR